MARGGWRPGAGRPPRHERPLDDRPITVCINAEDSEYLHKWCERRNVPIAALLREAALEAAGAANLGLGMREAAYRGEYGELWDGGAITVPVRLSSQQREAIIEHATKIGAPYVSRMMREQAISYVERDNDR